MPIRLTAALAAVALIAGAGTAFADGGHDGRDDNDHHDDAKVLKSDLFGSMPDGPVLFGVKPGGAPWVIGKGEAKARRDGSVKVEVEGLIIPTTGTNPVNGIAATVYCGGSAVGTTKAYPFSADGDAKFEARLPKSLPSPCLAPAVLLNPAPNGTVAAAYIAATGV